MIQFHRMPQLDIVSGGIKKPLLVIAWKTPNSYSRLFCIWSGGVWLRLLGKKRICWRRSRIKHNA